MAYTGAQRGGLRDDRCCDCSSCPACFPTGHAWGRGLVGGGRLVRPSPHRRSCRSRRTRISSAHCRLSPIGAAGDATIRSEPQLHDASHAARRSSLIRTGRVVPFAREMSSTTPNLRDVTYKMSRYFDPLPEESGCIDEIGMTYHGFASPMWMRSPTFSRPRTANACTMATPPRTVTPDRRASPRHRTTRRGRHRRPRGAFRGQVAG